MVKTQSATKDASKASVSRNFKNFSDFDTQMKRNTFSNTRQRVLELKHTHELLSQRNFKSSLTIKCNKALSSKRNSQPKTKAKNLGRLGTLSSNSNTDYGGDKRAALERNINS